MEQVREQVKTPGRYHAPMSEVVVPIDYLETCRKRLEHKQNLKALAMILLRAASILFGGFLLSQVLWR